MFKTGLISPVWKKGKDSKLLENYRGITVAAISLTNHASLASHNEQKKKKKKKKAW